MSGQKSGSAQSSERNDWVGFAVAAIGAALVYFVGRAALKKEKAASGTPANEYWFCEAPSSDKIYHLSACRYARRIGVRLGWSDSQQELFAHGYRPCMRCMPDRYPYRPGEWVPHRSDWM